MGKRYYCDYCDVSLPDTKDGRKKHNAGIVHQRVKEAHFRQYTDARTRLNQELQKTPCRMFLQGLPCRFGDDCRFSHLHPHELDHLRYSAEAERVSSIKLPSQLKKKVQPIEDFVGMVESLVKKREAIISQQITNPNSWNYYEVGRDDLKRDAQLPEVQ